MNKNFLRRVSFKFYTRNSSAVLHSSLRDYAAGQKTLVVLRRIDTVRIDNIIFERTNAKCT